MKTVKELLAEAKAKVVEAQKHIGSDMTQYETCMAEAKSLRVQAEALQESEAVLAGLNTPNLPTSGLPMDDPQESLTPTVDAAEDYLAKAIYSIRYGDQEKAVQQVLVDLHGPNYEYRRLAQYKAFIGYLRNYTREPSGEEYTLLREIILPPEYALKAIKSGADIAFIKATMVEAIDTLGGYVVPVDFQTEIIRRIVGLTVMRGRARQQPTSRDKVEIPILTGGDDQYTTAVRVTWVAETPTAGTADTNLTFGLENIPVHDVMAETFLSRNVVEDAAVNLVDELTTAFAEASAIDEDNQFLTGDGIGKPKGILIGGTTPETGVTTVNSGAAADIDPDGLIDLEYEIPTQYRANCGWICARKTVRNMRKLKGGDGHYLWGPPDLSGQPATFDGFPIWEQEVMPAIAASAYPILFGDPQGYRIVDRIGMTVERYLDSATARQNLVLYIMRRRLGGLLTNPERWSVQLISA
jgi:HK97 family phage major capsid protein